MAWTEKQWGATCSLLRSGWPGPFSEGDAVAYRVFLDDYEPAQVRDALKVLVRKGGSFRPSVSELVGAITADPTKPAWPEAYRDLRRALNVRQSYFAKDSEKEEVCVSWLAEHSHELVAAFFRAQTHGRLVALELDDPDSGEWHVKRLREDWEAFVDSAGERQAHGVALDQGTARRQLEGPRQFDRAALMRVVDEPPDAAEVA